MYKESKTLKTLVYAQGLNQISLRVANLDDHFDNKQIEDKQQFDVNSWAREYFLEANGQNATLLKDLKIEINEMNLGGSIEKAKLKYDAGGALAQTKWKTDSKSDPKNAPQKPVDFVQNLTLPAVALGQSNATINEVNYLVNLEP